MAGMFKRKGVFQAKYYVNGRARYKSLKTRRLDVAKKRLAKLELALEETGNPDRSHTPLKAFLDTYRRHIETTRGRPRTRSTRDTSKKPEHVKVVRKTAANELSRLKQFFQWLDPELVPLLLPDTPGPKGAGRHREVRTLEAITPVVISGFLADKQRDGRQRSKFHISPWSLHCS